MRRLRRLAHLVLFCPFSKGLQVGARLPGFGAGRGGQPGGRLRAAGFHALRGLGAAVGPGGVGEGALMGRAEGRRMLRAGRPCPRD